MQPGRLDEWILCTRKHVMGLNGYVYLLTVLAVHAACPCDAVQVASSWHYAPNSIPQGSRFMEIIALQTKDWLSCNTSAHPLLTLLQGTPSCAAMKCCPKLAHTLTYKILELTRNALRRQKSGPTDQSTLTQSCSPTDISWAKYQSTWRMGSSNRLSAKLYLSKMQGVPASTAQPRADTECTTSHSLK